ncbi:MAG: DEAD/DEAH box helicase, partial [Clostridia bacterium]|nr:DEAD/DEAH box helicase [Clostridia bacterium]
MPQNNTAAERISFLYEPLSEIDAYNKLLAAAEKPGTLVVTGLDDSQRLHLVAGVARAQKRMLLFVTPTDQLAQRATDDLLTMMGGRVQLFPAREISLIRAAAASAELSARRIEALGAARSGGLRAMVAPVDALMHRLMPPASFMKGVIALQEGMTIDPDEVLRFLAGAGYERVDMVESRGQYCRRGGIIDVFPVGRPSALRLEFFDDELDSLRDFDAMSQRSTDRVSKAYILPASETLLTPEEASAAAERVRAAMDAQLQRLHGANDKGPQPAETEFGLTPWEDFLSGIDDGEDTLPSLDDLAKAVSEPKNAPAQKTYDSLSNLEKQFLPRLDALSEGQMAVPGLDALMPFLYDGYTVMDYLKNPIVVLDQPDRLKSRCENRYLEFQEQLKIALERENALPEQSDLLIQYDDLLRRLTAGTNIALMPLAVTQEGLRVKEIFHFEGLNGGGYQSNMKELAREIRQWKKDGWRVAILAGGAARGQRLSRTLDELGAPIPYAGDVDALKPGQPLILPMGISRGFQYVAQKFAVVSETDIYGAQRQKNRSSWHAGERIAAFTDLTVGDYIVHESYGIGQYLGTERIQVGGAWGDYLLIRYQDSDRLYVPTDQLDRVQKYIGSDEAPPKINKLSGNEWQKQKARVKAAIEEVAEDLVQLYAERHDSEGFAFSPDTPWQREFEDRFPYDETDDQITAIEEIKRDMESHTAMDRLLCGDVGYGKTEVALRAIFKCVMDGKQAALLAPTTILVQQHYQTILKRFEGYPIKVDVLSRFRTPSQQKSVARELAAGHVDVIVGTHRLLGSDINFKDLGLLVIDEEQRFGVKHKEAIKKLKKNIDVLTLSATPIPRTLHMSMVGIRDMSLLRTPPEERYPVQNYVVEYS